LREQETNYYSGSGGMKFKSKLSTLPTSYPYNKTTIEEELPENIIHGALIVVFV
jgi:hypothetical protein